ncbi:hypothetical protein IU414_06310 [Nocardia farcinica]|nr:hypothetical protein [Nocardia farcinica]MBF6584371.1 hypothetical protein [Nocardia farcinica]
MKRDEESEMRAWIERQLRDCPPLTEQQKQLIRAMYAEVRSQRKARAAA